MLYLESVWSLCLGVECSSQKNIFILTLNVHFLFKKIARQRKYHAEKNIYLYFRIISKKTPTLDNVLLRHLRWRKSISTCQFALSLPTIYFLSHLQSFKRETMLSLSERHFSSINVTPTMSDLLFYGFNFQRSLFSLFFQHSHFAGF